MILTQNEFSKKKFNKPNNKIIQFNFYKTLKTIEIINDF